MGKLEEEEVRNFARKKHKGQLDDCKKDYFNTHILQVVNILKQVTKNEDIIFAGYLHDTLEDTDTTYDELKDRFGYVVADLVNEITHEGDKNDGFCFPRLKTQNGIVLKFADRLSNLSRMDSWGRDRTDHYLRKSKFWKLTQDEV